MERELPRFQKSPAPLNEWRRVSFKLQGDIYLVKKEEGIQFSQCFNGASIIQTLHSKLTNINFQQLFI